MSRAPAKDSLQGKINSQIAKERVFSPPEDMEPLVGDEISIWNQYIASRFDWKQQDLRTVHSIVKTDSQYRRISEEARAIPPTYQKASGDWAAHPIHNEVRQMQKMLQSEIRLLGLYPEGHEKDKFSGAALSSEATRGKKKKMSLVG